MENRLIKFLIYEEEEAAFAEFRNAISHEFPSSFGFERVTNANEALRALKQKEYDACVLNCSRMSLDLVRDCISHKCIPPVTIMTGRSSVPEERKLEKNMKMEIQPQLVERLIQSLVAHDGKERIERDELSFWANFFEDTTAIALLDAHERIVAGNTALRKLFAYREREIRQLSLSDLLHPDDIQKNKRFFQQLSTGKETQYQSVSRWLHKDGREMLLQQSALGLVDAKKSSPGFVLLALEVCPAHDAIGEARPFSSQLIAAHESDRKLIAQELHDSLGAFLSAIKYSLEKNLNQLQNNKKEAEISLGEIIPLVHDAIEEIRRISGNLWPSMLDDLGMLAAVNSLCSEFEKTYNSIRIEKRVEVLEQEIPPHLKVIIYRILQEALTNVAKHSRATRVKLSLLKTGRQLELLIEDNGRGGVYQETAARGSGGIGLSSMRNRTEFSGGVFRIEPARGGGTRVQAVWPRQ